MWPFPRRRPKQPPKATVIPNVLDQAPPIPESPAEELLQDLEQSRETLNRIQPQVLARAQDLDIAAQIVLSHLDNFLTDVTIKPEKTWNGSVNQAQALISATVGTAPDVVLRTFKIGRTLQWPALLVYIDGMVDTQVVDQDILAHLESFTTNHQAPAPSPLVQTLQQSVLAASSVENAGQWDDAILKMLAGNTLLFIDGASAILSFDTVKYTQRSIGDSKAEPAVKGPQEAFSDISLIQMSQIRRRLITPDLRFVAITLGKYSHTKVLLVYIDGLTNPALLDMVQARLSQINRDSVQMSSEVADYLTKRHFTLFPAVRVTDRVDIVVRDILMGKLALMVPNDPFVVTLPNRLMDFYQTTQDYVFNVWEASLVRFIRLVGLVVGLYTMPFYIALTSVDPDLMPTRLVLSIAGSRIGVPFPPITEAIIMWLIVEIIREATNRLPQQMATSIGTVGAVVVGTAVVKAGLVDPVVIIGVTLTALGFFTTPTFEMNAPWRWVFWMLVTASYVFGVYGIVLVSMGVISYLASLDVFGVAYLAPFAPETPTEFEDSVIRLPASKRLRRPPSYNPLDTQHAETPPPDNHEPDAAEWKERIK